MSTGNPRPDLSTNIVNIATGNVINESDDVWNMNYLVYEDPYQQFTDFYSWVYDSNTSTAETLDQDNAGAFSNYMIRLSCDFVNAGTPENMACCVASADKGGYCIKAGATGDLYTTYVLTAAQVTTLTSTDVLDAAAEIDVDDTVTNAEYFQYFGCDGAQDYRYTCYKYMPKWIKPEVTPDEFADTSVDGAPRLGVQEAAAGTGITAVWFDGTNADTEIIADWTGGMMLNVAATVAFSAVLQLL